MKRAILGLAVAAALSLPAAADHYYRGTIRAVSPTTVWLNTSQGVVAVPFHSATFLSGNVQLNYGSLYPGRPITVFTPVLLDQRAVRWDDDDNNRNRGRGKKKGHHKNHHYNYNWR